MSNDCTKFEDNLSMQSGFEHTQALKIGGDHSVCKIQRFFLEVVPLDPETNTENQMISCLWVFAAFKYAFSYLYGIKHVRKTQ